MKILVTGAHGMLGRNIVDALSRKRIDVIAPSRDVLDLSDAGQALSYLKLERPCTVIHCAGKVGGIHSNIKAPYDYFLKNLEVGISIIEASRQCEVEKFLNIGSAAMYPSGPGERKVDDILMGKLDAASEGYCLSKLSVAKMVEFCNRQYDTSYKTIIPCNLYGEHDNFDPNYSHMIPSVIRKIHDAKKENSKCEIWGNGLARREFMFARDAVDFIMHGLENYDMLPTYTNLGLGCDYSILEYHRVISKVIGYEGDFYHDLSKPVGAKSRTLDISAQQRLNWKPSFTLAEGVHLTYRYFLKIIG